MGVKALLNVTGRLGAPRMFEQSVKLTTRNMAIDRGLVSMDKRALYPGPIATLTEVCEALGIGRIDQLAPHLKAAHSVHFGSDGGISKCYLEFAPDEAPEDGLVFLALKMKADVTRLSSYKLMPQPDAADWIAAQIGDGTALGSGASKTLALAQKNDPDGEAVVLHVTEQGTDRASVDISVADAAVSLSDSVDLLSTVFAHFELGSDSFLAEHGHRQFGHLAIGHDQRGDDFATIYYGAQPI